MVARIAAFSFNPQATPFHMRKNALFALLLTAAFPLVASGQDNVPVKAQPENTFRPAWIVKFAPLALTDLDPTLQGGVEYCFRPNMSVQQEIGFLKISNWINIDEKYPRSVFRSRSEVRLYISQRKAAPLGTYLALEVLYKNISQPRESEMNRGSYFELTKYRYVKNVLGGHFKIGVQTTIGGGDRWLFDAYIGLGLRGVRLKAIGENASIEALDLDRNPLDVISIGSRRTHYTVPSGTFGFKIGYLLGAGEKR